MSELVFLKNDEMVTDSLTVAEVFGKRHDKLVSEIERMYPEQIAKGYAQNGGHPLFYKTRYKHPQNGQMYTKYVMNRDGFSLLVMGFTGKKALEWKLKYITAFNRMESVLIEKHTSVWVETREYGKLTRQAETDTIQKLVEYAKEQGSEHSDKLYMVYTRLANRMAGIENRDQSTVKQLNNLVIMEDIILHIIDQGIFQKKHYKEIYQDCKKRLEMVKDLAFLEAS